MDKRVSIGTITLERTRSGATGVTAGTTIWTVIARAVPVTPSRHSSPHAPSCAQTTSSCSMASAGTMQCTLTVAKSPRPHATGATSCASTWTRRCFASKMRSSTSTCGVGWRPARGLASTIAMWRVTSGGQPGATRPLCTGPRQTSQPSRLLQLTRTSTMFGFPKTTYSRKGSMWPKTRIPSGPALARRPRSISPPLRCRQARARFRLPRRYRLPAPPTTHVQLRALAPPAHTGTISTAQTHFDATGQGSTRRLTAANCPICATAVGAGAIGTTRQRHQPGWPRLFR
mmetsp:Transcript_5846/g.13885  ORF Transcript_5846/g.13885 Transcript_5846/m.13885 type:complete len:287 (+) Transcript_5846:1072-1932(+)